MTVNWKEVCKFLSGAFFVSTGVLFYLYLAGSPVPVLGAHLEVTPTVNGVRATVHVVFFVVFFYLYLAGSPVPVLGARLAITPTVNGVRAVVHAVLFVVFFYLGYIRK